MNQLMNIPDARVETLGAATRRTITEVVERTMGVRVEFGAGLVSFTLTATGYVLRKPEGQMSLYGIFRTAARLMDGHMRRRVPEEHYRH